MAIDRDRFPVHVQTIAFERQDTEMFYPRIVGMSNRAAEQRMNQAIVNQVDQLVAEQRKVQVAGQTQMLAYYDLKNNQRGVLSLLQVNYAYTPHMAHGMTFAKSLTFDIRTGMNYSLREQFKPGTDYVQVISELIRVQIKERNIQLLGEFTVIRPDQDFYIADKVLVVYFQLYEITPYYVGFPMFPISVYSLQDIIAEDSPLGQMLADV